VGHVAFLVGDFDVSGEFERRAGKRGGSEHTTVRATVRVPRWLRRRR
jgi:hypothetical protein